MQVMCFHKIFCQGRNISIFYCAVATPCKAAHDGRVFLSGFFCPLTQKKYFKMKIMPSDSFLNEKILPPWDSALQVSVIYVTTWPTKCCLLDDFQALFSYQ